MSHAPPLAVCSIVPVSGFYFLQKWSCATCPFGFTQWLRCSKGICQHNFWNAWHICGTNILTMTSVTSVGWWPSCQMAIPPTPTPPPLLQSEYRWEGWPGEYNLCGAIWHPLCLWFMSCPPLPVQYHKGRLCDTFTVWHNAKQHDLMHAGTRCGGSPLPPPPRFLHCAWSHVLVRKPLAILAALEKVEMSQGRNRSAKVQPGGMCLYNLSRPPSSSLFWCLPSLKFIGIITCEKSVPSEDRPGWGWVADCNLMTRLKYAKANK